jgi:hypothetical protein
MRGSAALRTGVAPGGALAGPWVQNPLWTAARAVPSLDLRFADNKSLVDAVTGASLVTFTRASSGTFVGSNGVLRSAVTNLLLRSEEFDNASWTKTRSSISADSTIAPNGSLTADKLVEDTTAGATHLVSVGSGLIAGNTYTYSVYAKAAGRDWLLMSPGSTWGYGWFNINNGTLGTLVDGGSNPTAAINAVGNGWYRCSITLTAVANAGIQFLMAPSNGTVTYTGDGTSGLFLWGAQVEQSATVGEYIPTTSTINSAPRFDHNPTTGESLGLLAEEQRTNLLLRSEEFGTTWTAPGLSAVTPNTTVAPNGVTTADTLVETTGVSEVHRVSQTISVVSGTTYTLSVFAKQGSRQYVYLGFGPNATWNGTGVNGFFDLQNGTIGTSVNCTATIVAYPNGWYRCTVTSTPTVTNAGAIANIGASSSGIAQTYTGDGSNAVILWGAQLEQGAFATSYIPTTTAAATRSADVPSITGSAFTSFYSQSAGTLFSNARTQQSAAGHVLAGVSTGSFAGSAYFVKGSTNLLGAAPDAAPSNLGITLQSVSSNVGLRAALAFTAGTGSASAVMNGGTVGTDASTGIPITMSQMGIGTAPWSIGTTLWNGHHPLASPTGPSASATKSYNGSRNDRHTDNYRNRADAHWSRSSASPTGRLA